VAFDAFVEAWGVKYDKAVCANLRSRRRPTHNLKVVGSNPTPATKFDADQLSQHRPLPPGGLCYFPYEIKPATIFDCNVLKSLDNSSSAWAGRWATQP
jgi:hypothetical protein